jgi:hypothetical protein
MEIFKYSLEFYVLLLRRKVLFSMSRWGDGEFNCIFGVAGENCDHHQYFPEMGVDLLRSLKSGLPYYRALVHIAFKELGQDRISKFLAENEISCTWVDGDVFLQRSAEGTLFPFIEILRERNVLYVGPSHLRSISPWVFPVVEFIEVPDKDCYLTKIDTEAKIIKSVSNHQIDIILFSASMATNVMIDDLYESVGMSCTMIDVGSLFDIYAGRKSRSTHTRITNWGELIQKNIGEE